MPFEHAMDTSVTFSCLLRMIPPVARIMPKETGSTHSEASAMRQSNIKIPIAIKSVEIREPINSGTQWDNPLSKVAQSAISTVVRSDRSFFPKNDRGILRSLFQRNSILQDLPVFLHIFTPFQRHNPGICTDHSPGTDRHCPAPRYPPSTPSCLLRSSAA